MKVNEAELREIARPYGCTVSVNEKADYKGRVLDTECQVVIRSDTASYRDIGGAKRAIGEALSKQGGVRLFNVRHRGYSTWWGGYDRQPLYLLGAIRVVKE